jgi:hypothetical protein
MLANQRAVLFRMLTSILPTNDLMRRKSLLKRPIWKTTKRERR